MSVKMHILIGNSHISIRFLNVHYVCTVSIMFAYLFLHYIYREEVSNEEDQLPLIGRVLNAGIIKPGKIAL